MPGLAHALPVRGYCPRFLGFGLGFQQASERGCPCVFPAEHWPEAEAPAGFVSSGGTPTAARAASPALVRWGPRQQNEEGAETPGGVTLQAAATAWTTVLVRSSR